MALALDTAKLRQEIQEKYIEVAANPSATHHFHTGRRLAERLEYPAEMLARVPEPVIEAFAGVGNPFAIGPIRLGETVVDVGCGAGFDCVVATQKVGPSGKVIGVDMTEAMLARARESALLLGLRNVEFRHGHAEAMPIESESADVAISNGVINLCPDKLAVYREIFRVLKPGGRLMIADIVVQREVPEGAKQDVDLWTGWIAGALLAAESKALLKQAGFQDIDATDPVDVFKGAKGEASASQFGTISMRFSARKPGE